MRCIAGISGKCVPSGVNITSSPVFFYHQRGNQGEQNRRQQYGFNAQHTGEYAARSRSRGEKQNNSEKMQRLIQRLPVFVSQVVRKALRAAFKSRFYPLHRENVGGKADG